MFNPMEVVESLVVRLVADNSSFVRGMRDTHVRFAAFNQLVTAQATKLTSQMSRLVQGVTGSITSSLSSLSFTPLVNKLNQMFDRVGQIAQRTMRGVFAAMSVPTALLGGAILGGASLFGAGASKITGTMLSSFKAGISSFLNSVVFPATKYANARIDQFLQSRYGQIGGRVIKFGGSVASWTAYLMGTGLAIPGAVMSIPIVIAAEIGKAFIKSIGAIRTAIGKIGGAWKSLVQMMATSQFAFGYSGGMIMYPGVHTGWMARMGSAFRTMVDGMRNSWSNFQMGYQKGLSGTGWRAPVSQYSWATRFGAAFGTMVDYVSVRWTNFITAFQQGLPPGVPLRMFRYVTRFGAFLGHTVPAALQTMLVSTGVAISNFFFGLGGRVGTSFFSRFGAGVRNFVGGAGRTIGSLLSGMAGGPPPTPTAYGGPAGFGHMFASGAHKLGGLFTAIFSIPFKLLGPAARVLISMGQSVSNLAMGFRRMALIMGIPASILGIGGLGAYTKLNKSVTEAVAVMAGYDANIRRSMEELAMSISVKTITPAHELGKGLYFLITAGMTASQSMGALADVEKFAVAGMMSMEKAAESLTTTQMALGLSSDDASENLTNMRRVMDVVTQTAIMSNATVSGMVDSFTHKASGALQLVNKDIEEGAAILAVYATRGIRGALAGERLSMMLRDLQRSAIRHGDVWQQFGLSVFDADGKMRHVADIIQLLEERMARLNNEQKIGLLMALRIPDRSFHAIMPLIGDSELLRGFHERLRDVGGTVDRISRVMLTSFSAQLKILWNNVSTVGVAIGRILVPYLNQLNESIRGVVAWWTQLPSALKQSIVMFGAIVAIGMPLLWLLSSILGMAWSIFANPISSLVKFAVVGTLLASLAKWIGRGGLSTAWESAKENMGGFFESAGGLLVNFQHNFAVVLAWISDNWGRLWDGAKDVMGAAIMAGTINASAAIRNFLDVITFRLFADPERNTPRAASITEFIEGRIAATMASQAGLYTNRAEQVSRFARILLSGGQARSDLYREAGFTPSVGGTPSEAEREAIVANLRAGRVGATPTPSRTVSVQEVLRSMGAGAGFNLSPLTGMRAPLGGLRFDIPPTPIGQTQFGAANAAGMIGQGASSPLGLLSRGLLFRAQTLPEQAQRAAGIIGSMADPLSGLLRAGTSVFDLSRAGGRPSGVRSQYDEDEYSTPVEAALHEFKEIALNRFLLQTPEGGAAMPARTQGVRDTEAHRIQQQILERLQEMGPNEVGGTFGTLNRGR